LDINKWETYEDTACYQVVETNEYRRILNGQYVYNVLTYIEIGR